MSHSLYFLEDPKLGTVFGCKPYDPKYWPEYGEMRKRVSLKRDLGWREVSHLQNILRKSDIWENFPAKGYTLVHAEFKCGDEDQRFDMLFLRDDGALLPCELKIGGEDKDPHGQLIRYIADLNFQTIDRTWIESVHVRFLDKISDSVARELHKNKFDTFLCTNDISDRFMRVLPMTGIIIDEGFPSQCLKAVRYLNGYCGFAIRLIQLEAYVAESWRSDLTEYKYRLDFADVQ